MPFRLGNPDSIAPPFRLGNSDGVEPDGSLHLVHADGPPCAAYLILAGEEFRSPTFYIQISHSRMGEEVVSTSPNRHVRILW